MGMLIKGSWSDEENIIHNGAYIRPNSSIQDAASATAQKAFETPRRAWLIASYSCPWSHRVTITRQLKGLSDLIPLHYAFGERIEGYPLNGGEDWNIPGVEGSYKHLHQLYSIHDAQYTGQATIPLIWDSKTCCILSNESSDIIPGLDRILHPEGNDFTIKPDSLLTEINKANQMLHEGLNNAVYEAGFAQSQKAYEEAVDKVFYTLDRLEARLSQQRFYFGNLLTETDIRLFPTLIRFDLIYYILFKCCRKRLTDYPALFAYTCDFLHLPGIDETINFTVMRNASYLADSDSKHPVVAVEPEVNWQLEHHRSDFGPVMLASRYGKPAEWLID